MINGCSVTKNINTGVGRNSSDLISGNLLKDVRNQNVTNTGFFIQKAEIEFINNDDKQKFLCSIKYQKPNEYLISIKNRTGIEGARICLSEDSIFVNDRINKRTYVGTSLYLRRKYGMTVDLLPIIFGDIVLGRDYESGKELCENDRLSLKCTVDGIRLIYGIDCKKRKTLSVSKINNLNSQDFMCKYENFEKKDNKLVPKIIEYIDSKSNMSVRIKIINIDIPWNGTVKFIPGKGYELIDLL